MRDYNLIFLAIGKLLIVEHGISFLKGLGLYKLDFYRSAKD
jgi:hypothetical protein